MKKINKQNLRKYNTLKVDAIAETFYIPESIEEIKELITELKEKNSNYHILSNGSNILFNNEKNITTPIIYMGQVNDDLKYNDDTQIFKVGCSVPIQKLINFVVEKKFGGIEYLYSLPALVGGCICMNAGGGRKSKKQISDFILEVTIFDGEKIRTIKREECNFIYRHSIFIDKKWIILGATFKFYQQEESIGKDLIKKRLEFTKKMQDNSCPNLGSVFKKDNHRCWRLLRGLKIGGAGFSPKTYNWFLNINNAKYSDFKRLIFWAKIVNKYLLFSKTELEIIIIEE